MLNTLRNLIRSLLSLRPLLFLLLLSVCGTLSVSNHLLLGQDDDSEPSSTETSEPDEDLEDLQNRFHKKVKTLENLRATHYRNLRKREDQIQTAKEKLQTLSDRKNSLEESVSSAKNTLQSLQKTRNSRKNRLESLQSLSKKLRNLSRQLSENLHRHLSRSTPYRIHSRKTRLDNIRKETKENDGTSPVERLNLLWQFSLDEFRDARSADVYTERVSLPDGRKKYARMVRIGQRILLFVTEDGRQVGLAVRTASDGSWSWTSEPLNEARKSATDALEIIQERQSPRRVFLPVDLHRFFRTESR